MKDKKIIFFDLDGTLLNNDSKISEENKLEIKKIRNRNFLVSIATGRSLGMSINIINELSIDIPVVLANGNFIYDPIKKQIEVLSKPLSKKVKKFYLKYVIKNKVSFAWFSKEKDYFYSCVEKVSKDDLLELSATIDNLSHFNIRQIKKKLFEEDVFHMSIQAKNNVDNVIKYFNRLQNKKLCKITFASGSFIDADDINVNKFNGIKKIIQDLKINDINKVYCFGDSNNDIEMIKNIPNSIAMGNANNNVKEAAWKIIGSNNESSIAKFIKTLN